MRADNLRVERAAVAATELSLSRRAELYAAVPVVDHRADLVAAVPVQEILARDLVDVLLVEAALVDNVPPSKR